ncbi:hypothetical protein RB195_018175 [Necator americanus]|uniref:Uncharacterized protein n=1 Tax=Necator americanus TaxID=51031 RepID=A0ABR1C8J2_NECAM
MYLRRSADISTVSNHRTAGLLSDCAPSPLQEAISAICSSMSDIVRMFVYVYWVLPCGDSCICFKMSTKHILKCKKMYVVREDQSGLLSNCSDLRRLHSCRSWALFPASCGIHRVVS